MTPVVVLPDDLARAHVFWAAGEDAFFSPGTVAIVLEVSKQTLSNWRVIGTGPCFSKRKSAIYYRKGDVVAWIKQGV